MILERLLNRVEKEPMSGCWIWTASLNRNGYARIWHRKTTTLVHRLLYRLMRGSIPEGYVLDHTCRVRCCVNPHHLEPVTVKENTRRGEAKLFTKQK